MCRLHLALFFFSLGFSVVFLAEVKAEPTDHAPKRYIVDLDSPPEMRWHHVVTENRGIVTTVREMITTFVPKQLWPLIEEVASELDNFIEQPYAAEMRGISKSLNCSLGDVVMATLIYDLAAFCTSIVSQDVHGQIWHSRNLDYNFTDGLRNITVYVDFQSQGKTQYSAVTFAGYVGVMTGQRPHAFTVTVNQRGDNSLIWSLIIGLLDRKSIPVALLVRDVLANEQNFTGAIHRLAYTTTAADAYFIVGGTRPGEGAVISKGHFGPDDIWRLNSSDGRWFLVETNYDHWKPPPPGDNRRVPATDAMKSMGQRNITVDNLYCVMSTPKVLNKATVYTSVMSAVKPGLMATWVRV